MRGSFARRVFLLLGLLAAASCFLSCDRATEKSQATPVLRLGYRPKALADVTPVVIAEGKLTSAGVRVELVPISSPPDGFTKLQNGEVDALAGMPMEIVLKQLATPDPKRPFFAYALQTDVNGQGWVSLVARKDAGVSTVSDLAGKTAASLATDQAEYLLKRILLAGGVPPEQVKTTRYNPATPLVGIRSGDHAAIFGLEPAISEALADGHILLWQGPVSHFLFKDQPVPVSASVIAADFRKQNPAGAEAFSRLIEEAVGRCKSEPAVVRKYFEKPQYGGLRPQIAERVFLPVMVTRTAELRQVTDQYMSELVRDGLLTKPVDLNPLFQAAK